MDIAKVTSNGPVSAMPSIFKSGPRDAKIRPHVKPLRLPPCDTTIASGSSSTSPSTPSTDRTDNHDTFGLLTDKRDMHREDERLKTFTNWPISFITPEQLAQNGFYYLGRGDEVRCAYCKVEIMRWVEGDDPAKDHKKWAPQCPFLRKSPNGMNGVGEGSAEGRDECGAQGATRDTQMPGPKHPRYATEQSRLASFSDWPRSMGQKPEDLAEAGFFYTGQGDKTKCFYCGGGLKDWENDDVPWEQHARWFDRCPYVQLVKGRDYVQRVISEACVIRAAEEKPAPAPQPPLTRPGAANAPEEKSLEDSRICKICYTEEQNVCFVPCGHVVACAKCALSTDKCPMCRRSFTNAVRLYFS